MESILLRVLAVTLSFLISITLVDEYYCRQFSKCESNPIIVKVYSHNKILVYFSKNKLDLYKDNLHFISEDEAIKQITEFMLPNESINTGSSVQLTHGSMKNDYKEQAEINEVITILKLKLCKTGISEVYLLENRGICGSTLIKQICGD